MKSRKGWLLTSVPTTAPLTFPPRVLGVVVLSKRVTNKAVDDHVRMIHMKDEGRDPGRISWQAAGNDLLANVDTVEYRLSPVDVYG